MFYLNNCSLLKYTALILYTSLAVILLSENTTAQSRFIWVSQSSKHDIENGTKKNPF
ncbi:MAG: hypothetical protein R3A13_04935 [Bdellovibrionota bacterium]